MDTAARARNRAREQDAADAWADARQALLEAAEMAEHARAAWAGEVDVDADEVDRWTDEAVEAVEDAKNEVRWAEKQSDRATDEAEDEEPGRFD